MLSSLNGQICIECSVPFADGSSPGYPRWCEKCHKPGNDGPIARSERGSFTKSWECRQIRRRLFGLKTWGTKAKQRKEEMRVIKMQEQTNKPQVSSLSILKEVKIVDEASLLQHAINTKGKDQRVSPLPPAIDYESP